MPEREAAWNASDYTGRVLRSYLRRANDASLSTRYDLGRLPSDGSTSDDGILRWIADIVAFWQRQAERGATTVRPVCRRWLQLDEALRSELGGDYADAEWWRAQIPVGPTSIDVDASPVATFDEPGQIPDQALPEDVPATPATMEVKVEVTTGGVDLSWTPPPDVRRGVRYQVERLAPSSDERGVIAESLYDTRFRDEGVPVAEQVWYFVTAGESGRTGSQTAWFVPPVTGFDVYCLAPGKVRGVWTQHKDCDSVRIWRTTGREPLSPDDGVPVSPTPGANEFTDAPGQLGEILYHIAPVYQHKITGREVIGRRTTIGVVLRPAPPVPELLGTEISDSGGLVVVRAEWHAMPAGVRPMLLRAWDTAPAMAGKVGSDRLLPRLGVEIQPTSTGDGSVEYRFAAGRSRLLPAAIADGLASFGTEVEVEHVPRLMDLCVTRVGAVVRATWGWPEKVQVAALTWKTAGSEVPMKVTDVELQDGGGHVEWEDSGPVTLVGTAELHLPGRGTLRSEPCTTSAPAAPLTLTFAVGRVWWRGSRWRAVRFTADQDCAGVFVRVWLHEAGTQVEEDRILTEHPAVTCGPGRTFDVPVQLPQRPQHSAVTWYAWCEARLGDTEVDVDNFNSRRGL